MREEPLTIYHYPELIPDLAWECGAPQLEKAVTASASAKPQVAKADTKLWVVFVLSGVGK